MDSEIFAQSGEHVPSRCGFAVCSAGQAAMLLRGDGNSLTRRICKELVEYGEHLRTIGEVEDGEPADNAGERSTASQFDG